MENKTKKLISQLKKKFSLSGIETQLFQVLIQQEINLPGGTTLGTHKALMNFEKESPVRRAYEEFHQKNTGRVPWRASVN